MRDNSALSKIEHYMFLTFLVVVVVVVVSVSLSLCHRTFSALHLVFVFARIILYYIISYHIILYYIILYYIILYYIILYYIVSVSVSVSVRPLKRGEWLFYYWNSLYGQFGRKREQASHSYRLFIRILFCE